MSLFGYDVRGDERLERGKVIYSLNFVLGGGVKTPPTMFMHPLDIIGAVWEDQPLTRLEKALEWIAADACRKLDLAMPKVDLLDTVLVNEKMLADLTAAFEAFGEAMPSETPERDV